MTRDLTITERISWQLIYIYIYIYIFCVTKKLKLHIKKVLEFLNIFLSVSDTVFMGEKYFEGNYREIHTKLFI